MKSTETNKPLTSHMQLAEQQIERAISEYVAKRTPCQVESVTVNYINERIEATVKLVHDCKQETDKDLYTHRICAAQLTRRLLDYYRDHENYSHIVALHKTQEFVAKVTGANSTKNLDQYQCQLLMSAIHAEFAANLEPNDKQEKK